MAFTRVKWFTEFELFFKVVRWLVIAGEKLSHIYLQPNGFVIELCKELDEAQEVNLVGFRRGAVLKVG